MFESFKQKMKKQESNPVSEQDKLVNRVEPQIETHDFTVDEQRDIVKMVMQDAQSDIEQMADWFKEKQQDIQDYEALKPSLLEGLEKKSWQSDRNLGQCPATCDSYQATLFATCWNVDTLHFKASDENVSDRADNLEKFAKWGLGRAESNVAQDVDDFIHNRITQGFSVFKVYWKVWYNWVDRYIPKQNKDGDTIGYEVKTENVRFEKGVIENIANLEDFLTPTFGKNIQELDHCIHVIHITGKEMLDLSERNVFVPLEDQYIAKLKQACFDYRIKTLEKEKADALGLKTALDITNVDLRVFPVDVFEWYGMYEKNGRKERYQFRVEPTTSKFLSGLPLRKVPGCRDGKYPFAGGALIRRPGMLRGKSLPRYIRHIINALNNVYNQKSDFQYTTNCPVGFYKPDENFDKQKFEMIPGVLYPTDDPKEINIPNIQRSMAWADSDVKMLLEMLERLTGAASYFMSNSKGVSGTATRDAIINEKSEVRFGLWVKRIIEDICEAVDIWLRMYQDSAPPNLGERVLGEDGKRLFSKFSVETLHGNYTSYMSPDIVSGSKTLEKQIYSIAYQMMQNSVWMNPQLNARGNWQFTVDTAKKMGLSAIENYMPKKPAASFTESKEAERIWQLFLQGEVVELDENMNLVELLSALTDKASTEYFKLDAEYRPNFDSFMFKLSVAARNQMRKAQEEMIAAQLAQNTINQINQGGGGRADNVMSQSPQPLEALPQDEAMNGAIATNNAV